MKYPKDYYCPSCVKFFDYPGPGESCARCGKIFEKGAPEFCPECDCEEWEMSCPDCGRYGDEMGLDHAECWRKDIAVEVERGNLTLAADKTEASL